MRQYRSGTTGWKDQGLAAEWYTKDRLLILGNAYARKAPATASKQPQM